MSRGIVYGNYFLVGRLNRGGMAEVFLGKRLGSGLADPLLAVKRMRTELAGDTTFVKMFLDEARIAGKLRHGNICRLYEQGQHDDEVYLAMEFIHGKDLRALHRRAVQRGERVAPRIVAFVLLKIAEALHYAHTREASPGELEGIVHRDISPQNILISYEGVPKLIDFGIAKAKDRLARTQVGVLKGKFAYMAPEQASGKAVDPRTDLFALGVVLYELLAGELPFKGSSDFSTLQRIVRCQYRPPEELAPEAPRELVRVVKRALMREPEERYADAEALAKDLRRYLAIESRSMNETTLSAYMRKLFRDDYIREMGHIRDYLAVPLPQGEAALEAAVSLRAARPTVVSTEEPPTRVEGRPEVSTEVVPMPLFGELKEEPSVPAGRAPMPMRDYVPTRELRPDELEAVLELAAAATDLPPPLKEPTLAAEFTAADVAPMLDDDISEPATIATVEANVLPLGDVPTGSSGGSPTSPRTITATEALILALAVLFGLGVVAATYWYVVTPR
ncbi:MAG: serine/threonine-protein kinase [Myxococcota bacterium]